MIADEYRNDPTGAIRPLIGNVIERIGTIRIVMRLANDYVVVAIAGQLIQPFNPACHQLVLRC